MPRKPEDIIRDGKGTQWEAIEPGEKTANLNTRLPQSLVDQVKAQAAAEGVTVSEWLRNVIKKALGK